MKLDVPADCSGRMCGFTAFGESLGCESGSGSCWEALLCEAERSSFHDEPLQEATRRIKEVLESIPPDREGRKLSFVHTDHGTLLAWVHHGLQAENGAVRFENGPDEVAKALRIKLRQ
jgi:hypothetical protein